MTIIVICYVAVDGIAFVATFYKSYFSLILSQLFLRLRVSFLSTQPRLSLDAIRVPGSAFSFALPLAFVVCREKTGLPTD